MQSLIIVDEDVAATGDSVVIDFEGFVDGEAFEGGKAERYTLEPGPTASFQASRINSLAWEQATSRMSK